MLSREMMVAGGRVGCTTDLVKYNPSSDVQILHGRIYIMNFNVFFVWFSFAVWYPLVAVNKKS